MTFYIDTNFLPTWKQLPEPQPCFRRASSAAWQSPCTWSSAGAASSRRTCRSSPSTSPPSPCQTSIWSLHLHAGHPSISKYYNTQYGLKGSPLTCWYCSSLYADDQKFWYRPPKPVPNQPYWVQAAVYKLYLEWLLVDLCHGWIFSIVWYKWVDELHCGVGLVVNIVIFSCQKLAGCWFTSPSRPRAPVDFARCPRFWRYVWAAVKGKSYTR